MSEGFLLDSNVVIALFAGEPAISGALDEAGYTAISVVVYGELLAGALRSARVTDNLERLKRFAELVPVLVCDNGTAEQFATVSVALRRKGRPIPENDIWIAATALQHGLTLVTRDRHFEEVEGLIATAW